MPIDIQEIKRAAEELLSMGHDSSARPIPIQRKYLSLTGPNAVLELIATIERQEKAARELVEAMETCHVCKGLLLIQEEPAHCEDCSYDCDSHDGEECTPIYELHRRLKAALPPAPSAEKESTDEG